MGSMEREKLPPAKQLKDLSAGIVVSLDIPSLTLTILLGVRSKNL